MSSRSLCRYGPYGPPTSGPSSHCRPSQRSVSSAEAMYSAVTRLWSVSSIRSTKVPPVCRANAQSYSAVRMLPTCRSPLGEGAKRTRTPPPGGLPAGGVCSVTVPHRVVQRPDVLDGHGHFVSVLQGPDARRGAGQQHIAGQQGHHGADVLDQRGHVVQQLRGARLLADFTVHLGGELEVGGVGVGLDPGAQRAERVEPLGPGPLAVPGLQVAGGHVVGAGVAEDDLARLGRGNLTAKPPDDHRQLALVVHPLGQLDRVGDLVPVSHHRGGRLEEQDGLRGRITAHLAGVIGVVAAHRHHLARQYRGQQPYVVQGKGRPGELDAALAGAERVPPQLGDDAQPRRPGSGTGRTGPIRLGLPDHPVCDLAALGKSRDAHRSTSSMEVTAQARPGLFQSLLSAPGGPGPATVPDGLLQVPLDLGRGTGGALGRVLAELTASPALAEQVPALVEGLLHRAEPGLLLSGGQLSGRDLRPEFVLGLDQLVDVAHDLLVIHESHRTGNRRPPVRGTGLSLARCRIQFSSSPGRRGASARPRPGPRPSPGTGWRSAAAGRARCGTWPRNSAARRAPWPRAATCPTGISWSPWSARYSAPWAGSTWSSPTRAGPRRPRSWVTTACP